MVRKILQLVKKILGEKLTKKIRPFGHGIKTFFAALYYGFPAKKLKLIGITGTKGKTTTTVQAGRLLNLVGKKTGYISSALVSIGEDEFQNTSKMTSVDGVLLNKYLRQMIKNGCECAVIELSSQGLEQNRHVGLGKFDGVVFLNLYPEHLEAHGGIEEYRECKARLIKKVKNDGFFLGNGDDEATDWMLKQIPKKVEKTVKKYLWQKGKDYEVVDNKYSVFKSIKFSDQEIKTSYLTEFDIENLAFATKITELSSGLQIENILEKVPELSVVLGRMDFAYQSEDLDILVDYAHEEVGMRKMLETLRSWKDRELYDQIIHVVSCDGVGRDDWKKPLLGDASYELADVTMVTTDNYEASDDPQAIVDILSQNFEPEQEDKKYYKIINRKEAFKKCLEIAKETDGKTIIVSTGVGAEFGITQPDGVMDWDEKVIWLGLVEGV